MSRLIGVLIVLAVSSAYTPRIDVRQTYWSNGHLRTEIQYAGGVYHGEYRTWREDGRRYEVKHFANGREDGLQQAWDDRGDLYLNYVVRAGRRYGFINARPCLPPDARGTSQVVAP